MHLPCIQLFLSFLCFFPSTQSLPARSCVTTTATFLLHDEGNNWKHWRRSQRDVYTCEPFAHISISRWWELTLWLMWYVWYTFPRTVSRTMLQQPLTHFPHCTERQWKREHTRARARSHTHRHSHLSFVSLTHTQTDMLVLICTYTIWVAKGLTHHSQRLLFHSYPEANLRVSHLLTTRPWECLRIFLSFFF